MLRQDIFGVKACDHLSVDKVTSLHRTALGGLLSLTIKLVFVLFLALRLRDLVDGSKDTVVTKQVLTDTSLEIEGVQIFI